MLLTSVNLAEAINALIESKYKNIRLLVFVV